MFLCIYISSNVCAAEMIDMEKTGSIVVAMSGEDEEISGGSLTIYKVAEITESKESYVFAYVEEWESCPQQLEGLQSPETAEALYQYAVEQEIQGFTKKIEEGTVVFVNVEVGLYLVAQEEAAEGYQNIHPFLISLPIKEGNQWKYQVDASPKLDLEREPEIPEIPEVPETPEPPSDENIPQTGQLNWPIPWMVIIGLIFFGIGWTLCFVNKGKTNEK